MNLISKVTIASFVLGFLYSGEASSAVVDPKCTVDNMIKASGKPEELEKLKDCTLLYTGKSFSWGNRKYKGLVPRWTKEANTDVTTEPPEVIASKQQLRDDPVQQQLRKILAEQYKLEVLKFETTQTKGN
jgi:hypothetical protein